MSDDLTATQSEPRPTASVADPAAAGGTAPPPCGERYTLGEEIAHGGMGIVYRATDAMFGREVAVKVLQEKLAAGSAATRRFADEARITGQLQHPGIPPVFDLGTLPDGRPFLAMKLIKGDTLETLLRNRPDPAADRGRLVAAFEQVCQAVAYAHAHGVIHRDLKPANVMVGAFGEVQVMDWGLAKVLGQPQPGTVGDPETTAGDTEIRSLRDGGDLLTQAGSVLGTPAYIPPEQALGAVHEVDARSDVFGLGAILAAVLTGRPPFVGDAADTTRVMAARGEVQGCFARLEACGADPELVALCKRCLAPKRDDRPADAGEVARAVAELRAAADDRARRAELDRVKAEGERAAAEARAAEQRKRRRVQAALGLTFTALVVLAGAFAWWQDRQAGERQAERERVEGERRAAELRRQLEDAGRAAAERGRLGRNAVAVAALLDKAEEGLRAGNPGQAGLALDAADRQAAEGGADHLADRRGRLRADRDVLRAVEQADRFRWTPDGQSLPDPAKVAARYRAALGVFGADPDAAGAEAAARVAGSAVRDRLAGVLDYVLWQGRSPAVRAALRVIDPDPFRDAFRDSVARSDRQGDTARLAADPRIADQPSGFLAVVGENPTIPVERRRELLERVIARRGGDLHLLMSIGRTYPINTRDGADQRERWFQAAVAVAPDNPTTHLNLGTALRDRGDQAGSLVYTREAVRLDPRYAAARNNVGVALIALNDLTGAEVELREAVRLDPGNSIALNNLLSLLLRKEDPNAALAAVRELARIAPESGRGYALLGLAHVRRKEYDRAVACYAEAVRLSPNDSQYRSQYGEVLEQQGDLDGAIAQYKAAVRLNPIQQGRAADRLAQAERLRSLLARLPGLLAGTERPASTTELVEFADLCAQESVRRYAAAAGLYERALAGGAKKSSLGVQTMSLRSRAAKCAVLAGRGMGVDAPADPLERAALRAKALRWLRANLAVRRKQAASATPVARQAAVTNLTNLLEESHFAWVRPGLMRIGLPAAERAEWDAFWDELRATLSEAGKPPPPDVAPPPREVKP
jgi:tetratricopeptide (TPR) repeat protein